MEMKVEKIARFLSVCDELIHGKFIFADTKIGTLLKAIAGSEDLTALFSAVTDRFDYLNAKKECLRFPAERGSSHGAIFVPSERGDFLAFVFCILVEIDSGSIRFNDFLLRYFYEDGSYTASYSLFVDRILCPFRDMIANCFPEAGKFGRVYREQKEEEEALSVFSEQLLRERARIQTLSIEGEEKSAADVMLSELQNAATRKDLEEIRALLCGYAYFLRVIGSEGDASGIFSTAERL
ncbi:MAG: hypothetical protein J6C93_07280 [Clostridia bacterium]|nr:hypothetical protein [Clostridia bacterium]